MPDEQSNLNLPATRRPSGRRRGRRGGRGRSPRSVAGKTPAVATENPTALSESETMADAAAHSEIAETPADTSGDFREPHPEEPADAVPPEEISQTSPEISNEPPAEVQRVSEPEPRAPRPSRTEQRRPEPSRQRPWVKPADFRPAETSAISQAVAHATEIAESLKHTIDQLDEILELVEVAERQKLADEREIDELRRALRRIQPPRFQPSARGSRPDDSHRGYKDQGARHEDHRPAPRPPREENQRSEEPATSPATEEIPDHVD